MGEIARNNALSELVAKFATTDQVPTVSNFATVQIPPFGRNDRWALGERGRGRHGGKRFLPSVETGISRRVCPFCSPHIAQSFRMERSGMRNLKTSHVISEKNKIIRFNNTSVTCPVRDKILVEKNAPPPQRPVRDVICRKISRTYGTPFCTGKSVSTNIQSLTGLKQNRCNSIIY